MKTIELSAALSSAQAAENLKNFVGLDAANAVGLMTPERLAAVAGEKLGIRMFRVTIPYATEVKLPFNDIMLYAQEPYELGVSTMLVAFGSNVDIISNYSGAIHNADLPDKLCFYFNGGSFCVKNNIKKCNRQMSMIVVLGSA